MNLVDPPLLELRDIHTAPLPPWWPPAPGWWLLALIVLVCVLWLSKRAIKRRRQHRKARAVLQTLNELRNAYHDDAAAFAAQLSILLRRVALERFPRRQIAGLHSDDWLAFLDRSGGADQFSQGPGRALAEAPYRPSAAIDVDALYQLARDWLKRNL